MFHPCEHFTRLKYLHSQGVRIRESPLYPFVVDLCFQHASRCCQHFVWIFKHYVDLRTRKISSEPLQSTGNFRRTNTLECIIAPKSIWRRKDIIYGLWSSLIWTYKNKYVQGGIREDHVHIHLYLQRGLVEVSVHAWCDFFCWESSLRFVRFFLLDLIEERAGLCVRKKTEGEGGCLGVSFHKCFATQRWNWNPVGTNMFRCILCAVHGQYITCKTKPGTSSCALLLYFQVDKA